MARRQSCGNEGKVTGNNILPFAFSAQRQSVIDTFKLENLLAVTFPFFEPYA
jgi:hypothetical protein